MFAYTTKHTTLKTRDIVSNIASKSNFNEYGIKQGTLEKSEILFKINKFTGNFSL